MKKIIMYATTEGGDGRVMVVGKFDCIEDIEIIVNIFRENTIINFEYDDEDDGL